MNQKIGVAVLIVGMCLCLTDALPTFGALSLGLGGQQYPRGYGGYSVNPYAGSYGGVGGVALDPVYSNGFGSEYGSRYSGSSYSSLNSPYYNRYGGNNYGYNGGLGGGYAGGLGNNYGGGGGFQY